jgi:hypothetical protein
MVKRKALDGAMSLEKVKAMCHYAPNMASDLIINVKG